MSLMSVEYVEALYTAGCIMAGMMSRGPYYFQTRSRNAAGISPWFLSQNMPLVPAKDCAHAKVKNSSSR
jgi:hypothetical protein